MSKIKSEGCFILSAFGLFSLPIFLITFFLPALPQNSTDLAINAFVDNHLLGLVGFWSSLFPFSSKTAANYVAMFGPLFAIFSIWKAATTEFDPAPLEKLTFIGYTTLIIGCTLFFTILIWAFYLTSEDLGARRGKYGNLFGLNAVFFSFHYSLMSFILFFMAPFSAYRFFYSIPRASIKRRKSKR